MKPTGSPGITTLLSSSIFSTNDTVKVPTKTLRKSPRDTKKDFLQYYGKSSHLSLSHTNNML